MQQDRWMQWFALQSMHMFCMHMFGRHYGEEILTMSVVCSIWACSFVKSALQKTVVLGAGRLRK